MMKVRFHTVNIQIALFAIVFFSCALQIKKVSMNEQQITSGSYGHMLNSNGVFSPDDQWVVYDTRNDQTHISRTCCIEKVNITTGEVVGLYRTSGQTLHGPGVGAVSYHPAKNRMIFIHGLLNCDASHPYSFTRRFGALLDESIPQQIVPAEARTITEPFIPGSLRGGTHAHSWSGDGEWISFTYNDFVMEQLEIESAGEIRDLRTIGVMSPSQSVKVPMTGAENFSGQYFSVVAATVTEKPRPGSDDIEKAFDECWVGVDGYIKKDGSRQKRAIAFQGHVRTKSDSVLTEVFVSDIPDDVTTVDDGKLLTGSAHDRPSVPKGLTQRRITHTEDRKYPGIQGPRSWLRSSPDGNFIYFLMNDDNGVVQVFEVSIHGGPVRQVTKLNASIQAQFNVSPDGKLLALIADNSVWTSVIATGKSNRLTPRTSDELAPVLAVNWSHKGDMLVYNRYAPQSGERFLQIYKIDLN